MERGGGGGREGGRERERERGSESWRETYLRQPFTEVRVRRVLTPLAFHLSHKHLCHPPPHHVTHPRTNPRIKYRADRFKAWGVGFRVKGLGLRGTFGAASLCMKQHHAPYAKGAPLAA
jgi:hypothetical protein